MLTTFELGRRAEAAAADFLRRKGCEIITQNWRTRYCEIDIIAYRDDVLYFCEVKYRSRITQGRGMDYITPKKLKQLHFAASYWIAQYTWEGNYRIAAIEVTGPLFKITDAIADLDLG